MVRPIALAAALAFCLSAGAALADVTVIGNGLAADCSAAARSVAGNGPARGEAVQDCTLALENEVLTPHERAATYVNRGVLHLAARDFAAAKSDFDTALRIEPQLAEALTNRGAALIGQGQDAQGISEIDRGLALNPMEPEKAYFNRAIAEERLGDLKSAYADYRKAQALKPDWPLPANELARFRGEPGVTSLGQLRQGAGALVALALLSAPAHAQDRSPAERQALLDLSRILGESNALRQICEGPQDGYWYERMERLLKVEAADQSMTHRLSLSFNAGFNETRALYPQCVDAARAEARRAARTAQALSAMLAGP